MTTEKRALLVGIEYTNSPHVRPLHGIKKDLANVKQALISSWDYKEDKVVMMTDSADVDESMQPTKANMLRELANLVADAKYGDVRLFCFAGHSSQILDLNGDEEDEKDEVLLPLDNYGLTVDGKGRPLDPRSPSADVRRKVEAVICDDDLRKILVDPLRRGVKLIALFDSCTSGTLLDLKHYWPHDKSAASKAQSKSLQVARGYPKLKRRTNTCIDLTTDSAGKSHMNPTSRRSTLPPPAKRSAARSWAIEEGLCSKGSVISIACTEDSQFAWTMPGMSLVSVFLELVEQPEARKSTWKQFIRQLNQRMCGIRLLKYAKHLKSQSQGLTENKVNKMVDLFRPQLGSESKSTVHELVSL